ncbi:hypothetical protein V4762_03520 [Thermodesulfobium sp. 4217-1]|uniref:hypothetical protein n=1 Tax=Thermodesulfobium sp. 4217-1 TaxID=3120013 RepID=UPI0032220BCD
MKDVFCDSLRLLNKNLFWLEKSFEKAKNLNFESLTEEDIEKLETLSNRFGRSVDILINKTLRALDILELESTESKLDILLMAEKRGFVKDFRQLIALKDLRNELAHEYIEEALLKKFKEVLQSTPMLLETVYRINLYVKDKNYCSQF